MNPDSPKNDASPPDHDQLLTDATGFPLIVAAFARNQAETATMLPVVTVLKKIHRLTNMTVVADVGMISEANQVAIAAAGLSFILGTKTPREPSVIGEWRRNHPGPEIPDGHVFIRHQRREGPQHPGPDRLLPVPDRNRYIELSATLDRVGRRCLR